MPVPNLHFRPGTPSWVDGQFGDVDRAVAFYSELFGWDVSGPDGATGYRVARISGRQVAGLAPAMLAGARGQWVTYFATDDLEETLEAIVENGGEIKLPSTPVADQGTLAIVEDNGDALLGLWQADTFAGAELVDEPGAMAWNERLTRSFVTTQTFYAMVFSYIYEERGSDSFVYSLARLPGDKEPVVGVHGFGITEPRDLPSQWLVWFGVPDVDAAVAKAVGLGGTVTLEPLNNVFGRIARLRGSEGEDFGVVTPPDGW